MLFSNSSYKTHVSGAGEVTEAALVRDIVYVFQGIYGKHVKMDSVENRYKVEAKVQLPAPRVRCEVFRQERRVSVQPAGSC